ncbi:MAG: BatA domain-containing protein [Planctomycetota bacterium]|nr:BatA domain-containing protein [Planctomycetota bacterium]
MGFLHPGFAWATIGLATIPLIVHLINRRRYREEPWAAMSFLLQAHRRSRRRIRIEQWLLIAVRTLVVILVGLAIARPHATASSLMSSLGDPRVDRVIIIDDSLSMTAVRSDGRTAFEAARSTALGLIDGFDDGDRAAVVTASANARARTQLVHDHHALRDVVNALACTAKRTDLPAAIRAASELLGQEDALKGGRVAYVLTDLSAGSVRETAQIRGGPSKADGGVSSSNPLSSNIDSLYFVDVGPRSRPNLAVRALDCKSPVVGLDIPLLCSVEIANHGDVRIDDAEVELRMDGAVLRTVRAPSLEPGAAHTLEFQVEFDRGGSHRVSARALSSAEDVLSADDSRFLVIHVSRQARVLAVADRPSDSARENDLFYGLAALGARRADGEGYAEGLRLVTPVEIESEVLDDYAVVVLGNVRRLSPATWKRLGDFVRRGGGAMIFLGDQVNPEHYNEWAGAGNSSTGLMPFRLVSAVVIENDDPLPGLQIADANHPVMLDFVDHNRGGLLTAHAQGYWSVEEQSSDARTLLRLETGPPVLVSHQVSRGRVLVSLIGADMAWTNLPSKPDFVPLFLNLTAFAAGDSSAGRNVDIGESLVKRVRPSLAARPGEMARPDGQTASIEAEPVDDGAAFVYRDTQRPGIYVMGGSGPQTHFAVNVDGFEGDLRPTDERSLRVAFGDGVVLVGQTELVHTKAALAPHEEFTRSMLIGLFALVFVESLMATWFGQQR